MVKNTKGGSGHKKFARKLTSDSGPRITRLRLAEQDGEVYAIATKMLGNGMFQCYCMDGKSRIVHIAGKFSGRQKRDNFVTLGKWVLVGLRTWCSQEEDKDKKKLPKCDLLEIYSDVDKERLRDACPHCSWSQLDANDVSRQMFPECADGVHFATEADMDRERLFEKIEASGPQAKALDFRSASAAATEEDTEEVVNFEDI